MQQKHRKTKQVLAIIGIVLLVGMYLSTLIFALIGTPLALDLLKISIVFTIIVPVLLYAYTLVYRLSKNKNEELQKEN